NNIYYSIFAKKPEEPVSEHSRLRDENGTNGTTNGSSKVEKLEMDDTYAYDRSGMDVHSNPVLKFVDRSNCCDWKKRWQLAILANLGFLIVFGIRCNFGAAKNHMYRNYTDPEGHKHVHEFNWTQNELSVMESSFFYGYLVTQVPAGFLAAKFPPNKLFGLAITCGSALNLFLPYAFKSRNDYAVAIIQIMQGLVQGVAYPSVHGIWRYWAPPLERSKLATTAFTGSYAGAVLGLPVSAFLVSYVNWSAPFYLYGVMGVIWSVFWFSLTFEKPAYHPSISNEEKNHIETAIGHISQTHPTLKSVPWKEILQSKPVWAIIVANFARSWTFYLLLQNQLTYMRDVLDMKINNSGLVAAIPHLVMGGVVLAGGQFADYLRSNKILSTTAVRKIFNCGGFGGEAFFMLLVAYSKSEFWAILFLILAVGSSGFAISGYNVNHLDIAPRYAAILMGMSNGIGTLAGLICPFVTEKFTAHSPKHGWTSVFLLASLIHFTGVTFYAFFASGELQDWAEPKDEEEPVKPHNTAKPVGYGTSGQDTNVLQGMQQPQQIQQVSSRFAAPAATAASMGGWGDEAWNQPSAAANQNYQAY
ncbi:hypothetical protein PFISCL1PPCAC_9760, partial [Pristionchus fissidentatus]